MMTPICDLDGTSLNKEAIFEKVREMGLKIGQDYIEKRLTVILILDGALFFGPDLMKWIKTKPNPVWPDKIDLRVACVKASAYVDDQSTGKVELNLSMIDKKKITETHVILVDDILDNGLTLHAVNEKIKEMNPLSLKTAVLLRKKKNKRDKEIVPDYIGFEIPDVYVIGYGLDANNGQFRNLPMIAKLNGNGNGGDHQ